MLLTGSFAEYPFSFLQEVLHHRRLTGLLEVTSVQQSGYFYVKNGEIKDGEVGKFRGAKALEVVRNLRDASFHFKSLEAIECARIVRERSFGSSQTAAATLHILPEVFRTKLPQVLSSAEAANEIVQLVLLALAKGARQVRLYASVVFSCVKNVSSAAGRRTLNTSGTIRQLLKSAKRKLFVTLKRAMSRRPAAEAPGLIYKSELRLPSLHGLAQSNVFLVLATIAIFYGTLVAGFYFFPLPEDRLDIVPGTEENVGTQSTLQLRKVSTRRVKRKRRSSNQNPQKKKDESRVEEQKFSL